MMVLVTACPTGKSSRWKFHRSSLFLKKFWTGGGLHGTLRKKVVKSFCRFLALGLLSALLIFSSLYPPLL